MEFKMKLAIGFITYGEDTAKYLPYFLPSLFKALEKISDYKIFCWDNSESDRSNIEFIASNYPEIKIIKSDKNIGFASAYNRMIDEAKKSGAEYFLVINPDTILEPKAIKELIEIMDKDKSLGSASPKVLKWDFERNKKTNIIDTCGIGLKTGLRFFDFGQRQEDEGQYNKADILGPSGVAGLYRMSALEKARENGQYFDGRMFMYKEDCDLAYRLNLAGFKAKLAPEAMIYHDRTISSAGKGFWAFFRGRKGKNRQAKQWSFLNQHIIFMKYWNRQNILNKLIVLARVKGMMVYALLFEQYLLKEYGKLWKMRNKIKKYGL